jgi:molecular chaperone GrpE
MDRPANPQHAPDDKAPNADRTKASSRTEAPKANAGARPNGSEGDDTHASTTELEAQVTDLEDRWRRALADLDNLRKRLAREIQTARADERARVLTQLLPVVDHLELALEHAQSDPDALIEGVRVVRDQAVALLERLGYHRIDEVGVPFDPARHEAVGTVKDPNVRPGTVVTVVRPGYGGADGQLRPAGVIVATGDQ